MTISLSDNDPRISYTVNSGVTQTTFTVPFEFFDLDDLKVYVDGTLKSKTTHYTLASGGSGATGSITMSVTGAAGNSTVVITRSIALQRTTDFQTSGPFAVASLNTELDKIIAIQADLKDDIDRSLRLTDFDTDVALSLPDVDTRKGKTLAFNATTGAVESGPSISDVQSVSAAAADIAALADIEDGTVATDAISGLAAIKANVTTVAGISSNVTTVAGQTTNMQNITDNLSAVQNAATNATTATTKASEAATSATNAASSATSATSSATTATTKASEASTSATNAASSASTASGHKDTATTKASEAASSATAAAASASTASTQASNASTSASTASTQATNSATSATASATSATASATSATAAASSATAAASSQTAAASSAAAAATALDSFDDRYLGVKSNNPSVDNDGNALVSGALYFNDNANEMRVYDGANWIAATSAGNVSLILYEYTATSNQTTFSGSDDNSATLSYTVDNLQVVMNGVILDPSDYTATNGTSVVLASGAATNDLINIYAFKSFTTADMVSKTNGGTFAGNVTVPQLNADNIRIDGNTISSTDTNGNVTIDPAGTGAVVVAQVASSSLDIEGDRTDSQITLKGGSAGAGIQLFGSTYTNYAGAMFLDATASTTGTNDAQMVFRTGSSPSEAMRIDRSGALLVGKTSNDSTTVGANIRADKSFFTSSGQEALVLNRNTSDGTILEFRKANGTVGSIGTGSSRLYLGTSNVGLYFATAGVLPWNTSTNATRDNAIDLGNSVARFDDIFATNGTIQTSDQNEKQNIASLTTAEMTAAKAISKLFKTFKWQDKVAAKGDEARTHSGVIAQEVQTAMSDAGLDASNYAFWCSDTWWETSTEVAAVEADEEAGIEACDAYTRIDTYQTADAAPEGATERTRLGIRYPELLAFVGAATEQRLADIETRLTALEAGE